MTFLRDLCDLRVDLLLFLPKWQGFVFKQHKTHETPENMLVGVVVSGGGKAPLPLDFTLI